MKSRNDAINNAKTHKKGRKTKANKTEDTNSEIIASISNRVCL